MITIEYFGLNSLEALPKLKEIDELLKEDEQFLESLDQVALKQLEPEVLGMTSFEEKDNNNSDSSDTSSESQKTEKQDESGKHDTPE